MKYRFLTYQELQLLEDDFSQFLYEERINRYEWHVLQDQESSNAIHLLQKFSDLTFDKVLQEIEFLEFRSKNLLQSINCQEDKMIILGISPPKENRIDFTAEASIKAFKAYSHLPYTCTKIVKYYQTDREKEIFNLIESGCYTVDSHLFQQLSQARKAIQN